MISIGCPSSLSSRVVWATNTSKYPSTTPSVCQRCSPPSMRTSYVSAKGSANTRMAISKLIACLRRLMAALAGSHSNRVVIHKCYYISVATETYRGRSSRGVVNDHKLRIRSQLGLPWALRNPSEIDPLLPVVNVRSTPIEPRTLTQLLSGNLATRSPDSLQNEHTHLLGHSVQRYRYKLGS
jgi:hypothetical protein